MFQLPSCNVTDSVNLPRVLPNINSVIKGVVKDPTKGLRAQSRQPVVLLVEQRKKDPRSAFRCIYDRALPGQGINERVGPV